MSFANDNFFIPKRLDVGEVLAQARRRHLMEMAGAGPLLVLMVCDGKNLPVPDADMDDLDHYMLRDWPSLIDGE